MDNQKTYTVTITETLRREVHVTADSPDDAWYQVNDLYLQEHIVLSGDDWADTNITVATPEIQ